MPPRAHKKSSAHKKEHRLSLRLSKDNLSTIVPPRLELSATSFAEVARLTRKPRKPGKALRSLMAGKPDANNNHATQS